MKPLLLLALCAVSLSAASISSGSLTVDDTDPSNNQFHLVSQEFEISGGMQDINGLSCKPCAPSDVYVTAPHIGTSQVIGSIHFFDTGRVVTLDPGVSDETGVSFDFTVAPFAYDGSAAVSVPFWFEGFVMDGQDRIASFTGGGHTVVTFDNTSIPGLGWSQAQTYTFTPEPASVLLLASGLLALLFRPILSRSRAGLARASIRHHGMS